VAWPLAVTWICLVVFSSQFAKSKAIDLDWESVPQQMLPFVRALWKAGGMAFLALGMLFLWNQWSHHQIPTSILRNGFAPIIFGWEALFLAYGEMGPGKTLGKVV